jgi:hypothetical protein
MQVLWPAAQPIAHCVRCTLAGRSERVPHNWTQSSCHGTHSHSSRLVYPQGVKVTHTARPRGIRRSVESVPPKRRLTSNGIQKDNCTTQTACVLGGCSYDKERLSVLKLQEIVPKGGLVPTAG